MIKKNILISIETATVSNKQINIYIYTYIYPIESMSWYIYLHLPLKNQPSSGYCSFNLEMYVWKLNKNNHECSLMNAVS